MSEFVLTSEADIHTREEKSPQTATDMPSEPSKYAQTQTGVAGPDYEVTTTEPIEINPEVNPTASEAQAFLDGATTATEEEEFKESEPNPTAAELLQQARTNPEQAVRARGIFAVWDKFDQLTGSIKETTLRVVLGQERADDLIQKYNQFSQTTTGKLLVMAGQLGVSAGLSAVLGPAAMGVFSILAIRRVQKQLAEHNFASAKDIFSSKESFVAAALGFGQSFALPALTGLFPAGNVVSTILITAGSTALSVGTSMAATYGLQRHTMKESRVAMAAATSQSEESLTIVRDKLRQDPELYTDGQFNTDTALARLRGMDREEVEPLVRLLLATGLSNKQLNSALEDFFSKDFQGKYPPQITRTVQTALELLEVRNVNEENFNALEQAYKLAQSGAARLIRAQTAMMLGTTLGSVTKSVVSVTKAYAAPQANHEATDRAQETGPRREQLNPTSQTDLSELETSIRKATGDNNAKIIGIEYSTDGKPSVLVDFNPEDRANQADLAYDLESGSFSKAVSEYGAALLLAQANYTDSKISFDSDNVVLLDPENDVSVIAYNYTNESATTQGIIGATILAPDANGKPAIHAMTTDDLWNKLGISLTGTVQTDGSLSVSIETTTVASTQSTTQGPLGDGITFWTPEGESAPNTTTLTQNQQWLNLNIGHFAEAAKGNPDLLPILQILRSYDKDGDGIAELLLRGGEGREWGDVNRNLLQTLINRGYRGDDLVIAFVSSLEKARKMPGILQSTGNATSFNTFISNATSDFSGSASSSVTAQAQAVTSSALVQRLIEHNSSSTSGKIAPSFVLENIPELAITEIDSGQVTSATDANTNNNGPWRLMAGKEDLTQRVLRTYEPDGERPFAVLSPKDAAISSTPIIIAHGSYEDAVYMPTLAAGNYEMPENVARELRIGAGTLQIPQNGGSTVTFANIPPAAAPAPATPESRSKEDIARALVYMGGAGVFLTGLPALGLLIRSKILRNKETAQEQTRQSYPEVIQKFIDPRLSIDKKPLPNEVKEELAKMTAEQLKKFAQQNGLEYPEAETATEKIAEILTIALIEKLGTLEAANRNLTETRERLYESHKKYIEKLEEQAQKRGTAGQLVNLNPNAHKITISDIHGDIHKAQLSIATAISKLIEGGFIEDNQLGSFDRTLDPANPENLDAYMELATKLRKVDRIELIFEGDLVHTETAEAKKRYHDLWDVYTERDTKTLTQATMQIQREIALSETVFSFLANLFQESDKGIYVLLGNHDLMEAEIGKSAPNGFDANLYNVFGLAINPSDFNKLPQLEQALRIRGNGNSINLDKFLELDIRQRASSPLLCTGEAKQFDSSAQVVDIVVTHDMPKSNVVALALQKILSGQKLGFNELSDFVMNREGSNYDSGEIPEFPATTDTLRAALNLDPSRKLDIVVGHTSRPDSIKIPGRNAEIYRTDFQSLPTAYKIYTSSTFRVTGSSSTTAHPTTASTTTQSTNAATATTRGTATVRNRWEGTNLAEALPEASATRAAFLENYDFKRTAFPTQAAFINARTELEKEIKENYPDRLDPRRIDFTRPDMVQGWLIERVSESEAKEEEHYQSTPTITALLSWLNTRRLSDDCTKEERRALMAIMSRIHNIEGALDALPLAASLYDSLDNGLIANNIRRAYQRYLGDDLTINQEQVKKHRENRRAATAYWKYLLDKLRSQQTDDPVSALTQTEQLDYVILSSMGIPSEPAKLHQWKTQEIFHDRTKRWFVYLTDNNFLFGVDK